jgi:hypothetical protein
MPLLLMRQCHRPGTTSSAAGAISLGSLIVPPSPRSQLLSGAAARRRSARRRLRTRAYFVVEIVNFTS